LILGISPPALGRVPGDQHHRVQNPPPVLLTRLDNLPDRGRRRNHHNWHRPVFDAHQPMVPGLRIESVTAVWAPRRAPGPS
jgi:SPX domain protein involved in polyphosphate accumulation